MKKHFSFLMLLLAFVVVSCEGNKPGNEPEPGTGEVVSVEFIASCPESGDAKWNETDKISVVVPEVTANDNECFGASSFGSSSLFSGELTSWSGVKDLVAIYPYLEGGYTFNSSNNGVKIDLTTQVVDAEAGLNSKSFMVGRAVSGAEVISAEDCSVSDVEFQPTTSIFSLTLTNVPRSEDIKAVYLECASDVFVVGGEVSVLENCGKVVSGTEVKSNKVGGEVINSSDATLKLDIQMLPTYASGMTLTLRLVGAYSSYTMKYSDGFDFRAGSVVAVSQDFDEDFDEESGEGVECMLADLSKDNVPASNTWVILDETAKTSDFYGLREALNAIKGSTRTISIEMPNLEFLPHAALMQWYRVDDSYEPYVEPLPDMTVSEGKKNAMLAAAAKVAGDMESHATKDEYDMSAMISFSAPKATGFGDNSLWRCPGLESVSFASATHSGFGALRFCTALKEVDMPELTFVATFMFAEASGLKEINLPKVEYVATAGFNFCIGLEKVTMSSLTNAGMLAFKDCSKLRTVDFPSLKVVQISAFDKCSKLENFNMDNIEVVDNDAFCYCTALTNVSMPKVKKLGIDTFLACNKLEEVSFPEVDSVDFRVFGACVSLKKALLPKVRVLAPSMFDHCDKLEAFSAPLADFVGEYAFGGCSKMATLEVPGLVLVENNAFAGCSLLTELSLPLAEEIGEYAFKNCGGLDRVSLPSVKILGSFAFSMCTMLEDLELATAEGVVIETLGVSVFDAYGASLSESMDLTIGTANSANISGNTLTVEGIAYNFNSITVK